MKVPLADDKRDEWEPRVERGAVITVGGGALKNGGPSIRGRHAIPEL
jgi:hypothetical protein